MSHTLKISELIAELQKIQESSGDLPAVVVDPDESLFAYRSIDRIDTLTLNDDEESFMAIVIF